jgi:hypothetical protein
MIKTKAPPRHILTYTGIFIDPLNVKPEDIRLNDIAHALSNICRYNGHVDYFYSVAQHSVIVAQQFEEESYLRKWALFHDGSEAYLGDVVAPLKYSGNYDFYLEAEERLMNAICDRFGLEREQPEEVDFVDKKLRGAEMRDLKNYYPESSEDTYDFKIKPWLPQFSKWAFLTEAESLGVYA